MGHTAAHSTNLTNQPGKGKNPFEDSPLPLLVERLELAQSAVEAEQKRVDEIKAAIASRVADAVADARKQLNKTEGTVRAVVEGCEVVSNVPKKIEWDAKLLNAASDKLVAANQDPFDWIDFKPTVSEKKYDAMPKAIRELISPARTLKHGKESLTVTLVE